LAIVTESRSSPNRDVISEPALDMPAVGTVDAMWGAVLSTAIAADMSDRSPDVHLLVARPPIAVHPAFLRFPR
jgi:hypothetical protein